MAYATLHERLKGPIAAAVAKELGIKNIHAVPRIEKVTVNVGINKSKMDSKETHAYIDDCLQKITGQKPVFTKTNKAISNFKTRTGMVVGCRVTLRGQQMEEFLDRLISYAIPRIRDFRGLPTKLDGNGNYSIGLKDHSIFPEVPPPDAKQIFGMQVVITTTAKTDEEAMALLKEVGVPFRRSQVKTAADKKEEALEAKKEAEEAAKEVVADMNPEEKKMEETVETEGDSDNTDKTSDSDSPDSK